MSSMTADGQVGLGTGASEPVGPLEQEHLKNPNYRAVATSGDKLTRTHWHIATANGAGWGFDGMDGVIFALAVPMMTCMPAVIPGPVTTVRCPSEIPVRTLSGRSERSAATVHRVVMPPAPAGRDAERDARCVPTPDGPSP